VEEDEVEFLKLSEDLDTTTFESEMKGSYLNRCITKVLKRRIYKNESRN